MVSRKKTGKKAGNTAAKSGAAKWIEVSPLQQRKIPSYIGEAAAVIAAIDFIYWASAKTPAWAAWVWVVFGAVFIVDWMLGGIADKGICRKCLKG